MSRLHQKIKLSLVRKQEICFILLFIYGIYKNAYLPVHMGYAPLTSAFYCLFFPILGGLIGFLCDYLFNKKSTYNNFFYGILFSFIIPISTPIHIFLIILVLSLFFHIFLIEEKDLDFNFIALGKILLIILLIGLNKYNYANRLESSGMFVYSLIDNINGHNISGLFTSNVLLIIFSFIFLSFDFYYKKEIPLISYGLYFLEILGYSIYKSDMRIFLNNFLNSTILFALVFIATIPLFSPYSKKRKMMYSIFIGILTLPLSLKFSFYEGIYIVIIFANIFIFIWEKFCRFISKY